MASSAKYQYLLPGERTSSSPSSVTVHHHGRVDLLKSTTENELNFVSRIYNPKENDVVIGITIVRTPDLFVVDINSDESAVLPTTAFDRGCLPSRQEMNRLSAVYARVVNSDPWTQTELSCESNEQFKKRGYFGLLNEGNLLRCSLELCQKLRQSQLISQLNRIVPNFQICLSQNGFVWYLTDTNNAMIAVKNVIHMHELENDIDKLINHYKRMMNDLEQQNDALSK